MCYRTQLNKTIGEIESAFNARFIDKDSYIPMEEINGFTFMKTPVITNESKGEIDLYHWGLIPFWAKDSNIQKNTLNARIETLSNKPAFRNSLKNRCLILANAYFEWQWLDEKGKKKQKYRIEPLDQEIFAFAGIYSHWKNPETGQQINSYSIITTEANDLMSRIHNSKHRMPVILKHQDQNSWLSGANLSNFAFPYEVTLKAIVMD